jgi:spore germination cell wall hydrolase CwlJ-like protein
MAEPINDSTVCLAKNLYFEARNQTFKGMIAVGHVTINRVKDSRFPNTVCEVVTQGPTSRWWKEKHNKSIPIRHKCQFSWYCDGKSDEIPSQDVQLYSIILELAYRMLTSEWKDITDGSTHYHADYVNPDWASSKTKTIMVGNHIFYRWEK